LATRLAHRWHHGYGGCGGRRFGHHHGPWGGGWGRWGGHHGWDNGDLDGDAFGPRFGHGGFGRGFFFRSVVNRLDATPAQEKVIRDAVDEVREAASKLKGEARRTRADVADAFRKPHFDEVLFGELYARHDRGLEELRKAFVGAGAKVHDALDERQRARLADLIEAAGRRW
jgi:hypothetical protein